MNKIKETYFWTTNEGPTGGAVRKMEVEVTIDIDAVAAIVCRAACRSGAGRGARLKGAVVGRIVKEYPKGAKP